MVLALKRAESRTRYYFRDEGERVGWDVHHPTSGGALLEEQEIVDYFPDLKFALKHERPDFVCLLDGKLRVVVECKNDWTELEKATKEAQDYADTISQIRGYDAPIAVGIAGTPDRRVQVRVRYRYKKKWVDLQSHGYPLTQIPSPVEADTALTSNNGTTDVQLPGEREFFSAAINISRLLRLAKIEEALRPKVIGAVILALYHGEFSLEPGTVIENINTNVKAAIRSFTDVPRDRRDFLADTLTLSTEADRLRSTISDIVHQLERLNVRSIMRSGVDFLGQFYETFLRYGQDTKKLGIVFTPRHITRFCAELVDVRLGQTVYDPACGTGGFLVAAFDRMMRQANTPAAQKTAKEALRGCDTNSTVWALAVLNMFFRGDGKSHIIYGSCFDQGKQTGTHNFALLNPPFNQEGEPETDFIDHALKSVIPGGRVAVVVKTSVMVDSDLRVWRKALVNENHVEAVISLPVELFYPTGSPTVILLVKAHAPDRRRGTFLARIENDGFQISKKRRIPRTGSQLPKTLDLFHEYERRGTIEVIPGHAMVIDRDSIMNGEEICAERWLPSPTFLPTAYEVARKEALKQLSLSIANHPDVTDELIEDYERQLMTVTSTGERPVRRAPLADWFAIANGRSDGHKNYPPGPIPYVSSGEFYNGIAEFVEAPEDEVYSEPRVSVSCFGPASVQPWCFCARGNGGSAVRVLTPRFALTVPELLWFVGQINSQRWRFHFGRMALPERLGRLEVDPPPEGLMPLAPFKEKLLTFREDLDRLLAPPDEEGEDARDVQVARARLAEIESEPHRLLSGSRLEAKLDELLT